MSMRASHARAEATLEDFMPVQFGSGTLFMRMIRGALKHAPELGTSIDHLGNLHVATPDGVRITLRPDMTWDFHG